MVVGWRGIILISRKRHPILSKNQHVQQVLILMHFARARKGRYSLSMATGVTHLGRGRTLRRFSGRELRR